ncbi:hypothetical protein JK628_04040 [Shewanella sp. KX20019]|uniref:hypothetical protein n=1 Tax=Shewanella sp. KX20019 TaxID=2803864 RepID=UPI001925E03E|nr:hypothetical protein [Shewanella sp. KX20019]QQX81052.1 hypothetical protein JK628_04040 [Shewanella sp. KX20019]
MEKHHILDNIPSDLTLEQFQPLVKTDAVLIEIIVLAAYVAPEGANVKKAEGTMEKHHILDNLPNDLTLEQI